jgi:hypothetical protein
MSEVLTAAAAASPVATPKAATQEAAQEAKVAATAATETAAWKKTPAESGFVKAASKKAAQELASAPANVSTTTGTDIASTTTDADIASATSMTSASTSLAPAPIPFRKTAATSGPEVIGTLAVTLLVLAGFAGLAWYARRRGWLDRWVMQAPSAVAGKRKLSVIEVLHVSRKTTLFRVSDGERELLLTESTVQTHLSPVALEGKQP